MSPACPSDRDSVSIAVPQHEVVLWHEGTCPYCFRTSMPVCMWQRSSVHGFEVDKLIFILAQLCVGNYHARSAFNANLSLITSGGKSFELNLKLLSYEFLVIDNTQWVSRKKCRIFIYEPGHVHLSIIWHNYLWLENSQNMCQHGFILQTYMCLWSIPTIYMYFFSSNYTNINIYIRLYTRILINY